jgi:hypothetical protein
LSVFVYAIAGYSAGYYGVNIRPYVPWITPILAWLSVSKEVRIYFRFSWFWWTSILFVIGAGLMVSASILARANVYLWMVILIAEAIGFGSLVEFIGARLGVVRPRKPHTK